MHSRLGKYDEAENVSYEADKSDDAIAVTSDDCLVAQKAVSFLLSEMRITFRGGVRDRQSRGRQKLEDLVIRGRRVQRGIGQTVLGLLEVIRRRRRRLHC